MDFLSKLLDILADPAITFAAQTKNGLVTSCEKGIAPMMRLLIADPTALEGAYVADRVIGKAAAHLLVYGKAAGVYAQLISRHAEDLLNGRGMPFIGGEVTPYIQNRRQDGVCPMEQTVLEIEDSEEAFAALKDKWLVMQQAR